MIKHAKSDHAGSFLNGCGFTFKQIFRVSSAWVSQTVKSAMRSNSSMLNCTADHDDMGLPSNSSDPRPSTSKGKISSLGADPSFESSAVLLYMSVTALVVVALFVLVVHRWRDLHLLLANHPGSSTREESSRRGRSIASRHPMVLRHRPRQS